MIAPDRYEVRARLVPGLVAVLPVPVAICALGLRHDPLISALLALGSAVGAPVVLASYVRQQGKALERRLFETWDGPPTTVMLRHRGPPSHAIVRNQLRAQVSRVVQRSLPSAAEEAADPAMSDEIYAAAIARLRGLTRDRKRFPLLFTENRNYGYERNLLAMRPLGLLASAVTCCFLLACIALTIAGLLSIRSDDPVIGSIATAVIFVGWLLIPSPANVRRIAEDYASQLAEAAWNLNPPP